LHENGIKREVIETVGIRFYKSRYHPGHHSIFSIEDTLTLSLSVNLCIPLTSVSNTTLGDVIILEEPEHLNWYRIPSPYHPSFRSWFVYSIGIIHTNYIAYIHQHFSRFLGAGVGVKTVSEALVKANCDVVVKLSGVLQRFMGGRDRVENVNGVRGGFDRGVKGGGGGDGKIYFLGKLLWQKGLTQLLLMEEVYRRSTGEYFHIDVYGDGDDKVEIERSMRGMNITRGEGRRRRKEKRKGKEKGRLKRKWARLKRERKPLPSLSTIMRDLSVNVGDLR